MGISTTINIHADTWVLIERMAGKSGQARGELIVSLLKRAMRARAASMRVGGAVRYQPRDERGSWRIVHVRFREDEYEFFTDMRKLYKMSVSLLLAYAVRCMSSTDSSRDNYRFYRHELMVRSAADRVEWVIRWIRPPIPHQQ